MAYANLNLGNYQITDADVVNNLKLKVICEYQDLLKMIEKGYRLDYNFIFEEISLVDLLENYDLDSKTSLFVSQFYLNNKWEITLS